MFMDIGEFNSQQLRYILAVAEKRSISKAAQELYISQPSLSQYIIALEEQLGAKLFDRSSYPIRLTDSGEVFVNYARQILALQQEMRNSIADVEHLQTGSLAIGASPTRSFELFPGAIAAFQKRYPAIRFTISEERTSELEELAMQGELDLILSVLPISESNFSFIPLLQEYIILAVPQEWPINNELSDYRIYPEHLKSANDVLQVSPVSIRSFPGCPIIWSDSDSRFVNLVRNFLRKEGIDLKPFIQLKQMESIFSMVNAGLGMGFVKDTIIRYGNYSHHPCYYRVDISPRTIVIAYKRNRYLSHAAKEFISVLKEVIPEQDNLA